MFESPRAADGIDEMHPDFYEFSDLAYFNKRKTDYVIEFKKEPAKTLT